MRVVAACSLAMLVFGAISMNWFRVKSRLWENLLLCLAVVFLFRPDLMMDQLRPPLEERKVSSIDDIAHHASDDARLVFVIRGMNLEGENITKTLALNLGSNGDEGRKRLSSAGIQLMSLGGQSQISAVRFGSQAQKAGFEQWFTQGFRMQRT
ncbi:MAG: DUF3394 domain-containing protein [Betaproteobacteria bacterium]|nr:DUF3394 domain-containing protein [Betaproteobacteria bacterium]